MVECRLISAIIADRTGKKKERNDRNGSASENFLSTIIKSNRRKNFHISETTKYKEAMKLLKENKYE